MRAAGETETQTCVNVSFVLLQSVLALESFATALCFTDEPGVSFAGLLVLLEAVQHTEEDGTLSDRASNGKKMVYVYVHYGL